MLPSNSADGSLDENALGPHGCKRTASTRPLPNSMHPKHMYRARSRHDAPAMFEPSSGGLEGLMAIIRPDGLSYWDLHGFLLLPTLWLLTAGMPSLLKAETSELKRTASSNFLIFILTIAVLQAFVWDSIGAQIGIWQFNPEKVTNLGDSFSLPLEEILWLFHHVVKAALWQLKIVDFAPATAAPQPLDNQARAAGNIAIASTFFWGASNLFGDVENVKSIALVATFFAPVYAIIGNLGERYFISHWRLFFYGWVLPGWWTVFVDCIGQQQNVWNFPPRFLTGVNTFDGLLKLDIALVYLVSTFAVTGTGAIILAACDECVAARRARGIMEEPTLDDLAYFIYENSFPAFSQVQQPDGSGTKSPRSSGDAGAYSGAETTLGRKAAPLQTASAAKGGMD